MNDDGSYRYIGKIPKKHFKQKDSDSLPIRTHLKHLGRKKRYRFIGSFVRSGYKTTFRGGFNGDCYAPTLLLRNVRLAKTHQLVTDHLWFNYTKGFRRLDQLLPNDKVAFNARVDSYQKGYGPREFQSTDYDLSFPTKITRVNSHVKRHQIPVNNKNALIGYIMDKNEHFYIMNDRPFDPWYVKQYTNWKQKNLK